MVKKVFIIHSTRKVSRVTITALHLSQKSRKRFMCPSVY